MRVFFVGKREDARCEEALRFVRARSPQVTVLLGKRGEPFPSTLMDWRGEVLLSYLSPWIIPAQLLGAASLAAINFHPGPPEYPGIGCTNFALYNEEEVFGITCHHMAPRVDTGSIIKVKRFPIHQSDSVLTLTQRCYEAILECFQEVVGPLLDGRPLPSSTEVWKRAPYRRSELNALCELTLDMDGAEMKRRIRAVTYPGAPGAWVEIAGHRFILEPKP